MYSSTATQSERISLTLPAQVVKEADSFLPQIDLGALALTLLEKYLRYQKRKFLAQQYQQYYQSLADEEKTEEKQILADFAALESEMNAFIEAEETNGGS